MPITFVVQWTHVFVATFWFGSLLFADFVLAPGLPKMSAAGQREFGIHVASRVPRLMLAAGVATVVLGFIRGTVLGDIHSLDDLSSTYGIAWLVGLVTAIATIAWAVLVSTPALEAAQTASPEESAAALQRALRAAMVELGGFLVMFTAMIVMHFS